VKHAPIRVFHGALALCRYSAKPSHNLKKAIANSAHAPTFVQCIHCFLHSRVNQLILGDNLEILRNWDSESVDLIYLDPPFFSNRNYEVIWGDKGGAQF
jgi:16S rRNA G966 N2-methylase RsmD